MKLPPRVLAMLGPADIRWIGVKVEDRDVVKRLPYRDRYWNPNIHAWVTPVYVIATLPEWLENAGYEVVIVDVTRVPAPRDWHAEYKRVIGHDCPHKRKKKPAAERPAVNLEELGAAA